MLRMRVQECLVNLAKVFSWTLPGTSSGKFHLRTNFSLNARCVRRSAINPCNLVAIYLYEQIGQRQGRQLHPRHI